LTQFSLRAAAVYRRIELNVYQKSTEYAPETMPLPGFRAISVVTADYHRQYFAKNPKGYCGIGGCGVPSKNGGVTGGWV